MKNLNQIRAKSAWKIKDAVIRGVCNGEVVKKVPAMIIKNGILSSLFYANSTKGEGYEILWDNIAMHCCSMGICKSSNSIDLQEELLNGDSHKLREVTSESMAWLSFARRVPVK